MFRGSSTERAEASRASNKNNTTSSSSLLSTLGWRSAGSERKGSAYASVEAQGQAWLLDNNQTEWKQALSSLLSDKPVKNQVMSSPNESERVLAVVRWLPFVAGFGDRVALFRRLVPPEKKTP